MTFSTIFLVFLALIISVGLSYFQYFFKTNERSKWTFLLASLRALSIFGLLLLLINPIITSSKFEIIKTPLALVVDNSKSIKELKADTESLNFIEKIKNNKALNDKYELQVYQFDKDFSIANELTFKGNDSKISETGKSLKSIYKNKKFPTILLSDGNQTSGEDFVYSFYPENKVFPVVVGDTTQYLDVRINQINVNKYAFLKNKFPVEVFFQSNSKQSISCNFTISEGNKIILKQNINFSGSKNSEVINVLLPAEKIGVHTYSATINCDKKEKNTYNNTKKFAVEVIDQRTEIALLSTITHPDLGMLKRSIEANSQRKVTILDPSLNNDLTKFNVAIMYQPNAIFKKSFETIKSLKINNWIITGPATDFNFLNQNQDFYEFKMASQKEDYLANFNASFNLFAIDNLGFEKLPPLENLYGQITEKKQTIPLLSSSIRTISTDAPLLSFYENQGSRGAFLFGSSLWKWRSKSYLENDSFQKFDVFIDKIIQFISSNNSKKSLIVNHEKFYNYGDLIEISAQFFNKNYEFDENAKLSIKLTNNNLNKTKQYDLLKSTNSFKANFDGLEPGKYNFEVKEQNSNTTYKSTFEILDFDKEKQFSNANLQQMSLLANQTKGDLFLPNQVDLLIDKLMKSSDYQNIEKEQKSKKPLIDWYWLLIFIAILLSTEWFLRKYRGLL